MQTINVVRFTMLHNVVRPQTLTMQLGTRAVPLQINHTDRYTRLLVVTDTLEGLPQPHTRALSAVQLRRDVSNPAHRVITLSGAVLGKARTYVSVHKPDVTNLGASLIEALNAALPGYQFV